MIPSAKFDRFDLFFRQFLETVERVALIFVKILHIVWEFARFVKSEIELDWLSIRELKACETTGSDLLRNSDLVKNWYQT